MFPFRRTRLGAFALILAIGTVPGVAADPPKAKSPKDILDRIGNLNKIATEKLESDIRAVVKAADQKARTDPIAAAEILKSGIAKLEADQLLEKARRESLLRMLKNRIETVQANAKVEAITGAKLQDEMTKQSLSKLSKEEEQVRAGVAKVLDLLKDGKFNEARQASDEIAKAFPNNTGAIAAQVTSNAMQQIAAVKNVKSEKDKGWLAAMNAIDKASTLPLGDIEYPKDWKEKSKLRKQSTLMPMTAKERAIITALGSLVNVNIKGDTTLEQALTYLSELTGQTFLIDKAALEDLGITYETPVAALKVNMVSLRTVLRKLLNDQGLTYIVKDEAIQITSIAKAKETLTTRVYYIGDLFPSYGGPGDPYQNFFGPGIDIAAKVQAIASIIDIIQTSIDPTSWQINGGPGQISFYAPTMSLVIKQTAELHMAISSSNLFR
jgi:hypothetical protein